MCVRIEARCEVHEPCASRYVAARSRIPFNAVPDALVDAHGYSRPHEYTHVHAAPMRGAREKRVTGIIVQDDW